MDGILEKNAIDSLNSLQTALSYVEIVFVSAAYIFF